jgi:hypothetical protein
MMSIFAPLVSSLLNGQLSNSSGVTDLSSSVSWTVDGVETVYDSISLSIENNVTVVTDTVPLTGEFAVDTSILGWQWDRRLLEESVKPATQYETFLGGHAAGLRDGTKLEQWQSGIARNIEYLDLKHYRDGEYFTWTPRVHVGEFSFYYDLRQLYSDHSYSGLFSVYNILNNVMYKDLRTDAVTSTIDVALYVRDVAARIFKKIRFNRVEDFTGVIESNARVSTRVSGTIDWTKLETRKREYIVEEDRVYLNANYGIAVGIPQEDLGFDIPAAETFDTFFEQGGTGVNTGRNIYSKLFPLQEGSVRVLTKDAANNTDEWNETLTLDFSEPTEKHFSVDYDLGIITMGGFKAPDLKLSEPLFEFDDTVTVHPDEETMSQYSNQGVIVIGVEEIAYYGRTSDSFLNCLRGFNNTIATDYSLGTNVSDRQHGLGTDHDLYLSYVAVPRIDYEVTSYEKRSAAYEKFLDIRPGTNVKTNDIVQILSADINLQEVILETNSPLVGGQVYGPVFYGTDVSRMTARGLDSFGNPVDDIDLTIDIISGPGRLNGATTSYTAATNTLGEIYALYNTPYDKASIEKVVSTTVHDGADTVLTLPDLDGVTEVNDIWVFQILKHDPVIGTVGDHFEIFGSFAAVSVPGANGYLAIYGNLDESYRDGWLSVVGTDGVTYIRNVVVITKELDGSGEVFHNVWIDQLLSGVVTGQTARFFKRDAVEWNPSALNGSRRIVYEWSNEALHPITGELGAYYPLQPDSISGNTLRFNNRNLPIPDAVDTSNNLGAYVVVAPAQASLQARGKDPISGRIILSNVIDLRLNLPSVLAGVDSTGALPIPYGWTLISEEFNIGAGIGGANFITINPHSNFINEISLTGFFS